MSVREPTRKRTPIILAECTNFIVMSVVVMITTRGLFVLYHLPVILILLPNFCLQV